MHCVQPVSVYVHDDVYELIGEISSSSDESELHNDEPLETYLTHTTNPIPNSQGMVRTKQTAQKANQQGLPVASRTDETVQVPTELQSDSLLEREYIETMSSQGEGSTSRGRRGRSEGPASTRVVESDQKGIKEMDDVKKSKGSGQKRRREQEAELEVEAERKDSESTESSEEEEREPPTKKPRKKEEDMTARELVAHWNWTARVKKKSETLQGWLKKTQRKRDGQNRLLRCMKPGTKSL